MALPASLSPCSGPEKAVLSLLLGTGLWYFVLYMLTVPSLVTSVGE